MIFENNNHKYMYKYVEINDMQIRDSFCCKIDLKYCFVEYVLEKNW